MAKNVYLTGFMGSGKSTVGPALAARAGRLFVDLDRAIEARAGMEIPLIFSTYGEPRFREIESEALAACAELEDRVVSLGGGALLRTANREAIARSGTLVYLRLSVESLCERLKRRRERRPLIAGLSDSELEAKVTQMLADRKPLYESADFIVDGDGLGPDEVAQLIEKGLPV